MQSISGSKNSFEQTVVIHNM